jgi:hypothetical protein
MHKLSNIMLSVVRKGSQLLFSILNLPDNQAHVRIKQNPPFLLAGYKILLQPITTEKIRLKSTTLRGYTALDASVNNLLNRDSCLDVSVALMLDLQSVECVLSSNQISVQPLLMYNSDHSVNQNAYVISGLLWG